MQFASAPRLVVYGIPNCDTVKKARSWLTDQSAHHEFHDLKKQGLPDDRLDIWIQQLGWDALVNRRGTTWRRLPPPIQAGLVSESAARALMKDQVSVIRRPVVEWPDGSLSVGFDPADWERRLARGANRNAFTSAS